MDLQLPKQALNHLTQILNSRLRLSYFPLQWKVSVIVLLPKLNKHQIFHSPPLIIKLCEKLIISYVLKLINDKNIIPHNQFGFRNKHSTIHQVHRITDPFPTLLKISVLQFCSMSPMPLIKSCIPDTYFN